MDIFPLRTIVDLSGLRGLIRTEVGIRRHVMDINVVILGRVNSSRVIFITRGNIDRQNSPSPLPSTPL